MSGLQKFMVIAEMMPSFKIFEFTPEDIVRSDIVREYIVAREKYEQNIKSNMQYRQYLQNNALNIMKNNQLNTCDECGICPYNPSTYDNLTQPFFYSNLLTNNSPFGYNNSDLKNEYLSRQTLQSRLFTPISIREN